MTLYSREAGLQPDTVWLYTVMTERYKQSSLSLLSLLSLLPPPPLLAAPHNKQSTSPMDDRTLASKRQTTEPPCNLSLSAKCPRVKSPEPRVTEFFYFGLQFYYLEVKDEMEMRRNVIKFSTFDAKGSEDMKRTILEDMKNLNNGDVGTKTGYKANGYFLKVEGLKDRCAYVYTHTQHAQCSRTRLLQISYCLQAEQKKLCLPECPKNDHKCLLPFFYPNDVVLEDYEHALREGCDNLKPDIEELQKIVASQAPHIRRNAIRVPNGLLLL